MSPTATKEKTQKKRGQILETAMKVFAKEGYGRTDVQVIADLAGVGKGTIYRHFGNKKELFLAAARFSVERLGEFVQERVNLSNSFGDLLRQIALECARYYELHPESVEIMILERAEFRGEVAPTHMMYRAETRQTLENLLRQAIERGEARRVSVTEAYNAYADLLFGSVVSGCLESTQGRLLQRVEHAVDIFLQGLLCGADGERKP